MSSWIPHCAIYWDFKNQNSYNFIWNKSICFYTSQKLRDEDYILFSKWSWWVLSRCQSCLGQLQPLLRQLQQVRCLPLLGQWQWVQLLQGWRFPSFPGRKSPWGRRLRWLPEAGNYTSSHSEAPCRRRTLWSRSFSPYDVPASDVIYSRAKSNRRWWMKRFVNSELFHIWNNVSDIV